ncbi:MAG: F0F1 ATP synthase subunit A [Muribaculaceae bacterium]|nr:F0F1 ATP synthase subunit A [Muribaculaceae bacterium]MDE6772844.1 F0F1 ATP synthase subunit A [Muribaculaceae bacterium]
MFSSSRLTKIEEVTDPATGKVKKEAEPQIVEVEKDGKTYSFLLAHVSKHSNKVVEVFPIDGKEQSDVQSKAASQENEVVEGYVKFDGKYYREYKPFDISITKNVLALFITAIIVTLMVMSVVRYYSRKGMKAPRKGMGFMEMLIDFIYTGMIKSTLGEKAKRYAPFLLTCFFFILTMNLLGLVVIFPGGANLTGNISVTLVLALLVFVATNVTKSKHYWKEIFWPDVPWFLKFPLPIMQFIEIFGIFTKPAALCVRLFANMMGGHMIVITLTLLIFIFASFGAKATSGAVVVSVFFSIFMLALDVLVSFIQAYVFTLLATLFISMSHESGHDHDKSEGEGSAPATLDI